MKECTQADAEDVETWPGVVGTSSFFDLCTDVIYEVKRQNDSLKKGRAQMTKYNWGIIGTGWIAHDMADALNKTNGEIYAAANPNEAHLTEFVKEKTLSMPTSIRMT